MEFSVMVKFSKAGQGLLEKNCRCPLSKNKAAENFWPPISCRKPSECLGSTITLSKKIQSLKLGRFWDGVKITLTLMHAFWLLFCAFLP